MVRHPLVSHRILGHHLVAADPAEEVGTGRFKAPCLLAYCTLLADCTLLTAPRRIAMSRSFSYRSRNLQTRRARSSRHRTARLASPPDD